MLVNSGVRLGGGPLRFSGSGITVHSVARECWTAFPTPWRNLSAGEASLVDQTNKAGLPNGYRPPGSWVLPQKPGALSSRSQLTGAGRVQPLNLAGGKNAEALITTLGTITGTTRGVGSLAGALDGSGTIDSATLQAIAILTANLTAEGTLTAVARALGSLESTVNGSGTFTANGTLIVAAAATLNGSGEITSASAQAILQAAALLSGSGTITSANTLAIMPAAATLSGSGTLTGLALAEGALVGSLSGFGTIIPTVRAKGVLSATVTPFTELSPQSLARAVWSTPEGAFLYALAHNKVITDPAAGTYTVYDEDGTTVLYVADLWENTAGTVGYQGQGADRRDSF